MKKYFYILSILLFTCCCAATAQKGVQTAPGILWQKTVGGSDSDVLTAMCVRSDKSITLCGYSKSGVSGDKSDSSFGSFDFWVVKMDSTGNIVWNKTFGGSKNDFAAAIINTSDGGYLLGGSSISDSTGTKTKNSYGYSFDYWVIKLDSNGNVQWNKTMGGTFTDKLTSLAELATGGYIVGGYAYSDTSGSKTLPNLGTPSNADYWPVILNTDGSERMQMVFGGGNHDFLSCVAAAEGSSFYAGGYSYSAKRPGFKSKNVFGNNDYYVVRYNTATKQTEFQADFGAKLSDYQTCMQVTKDSSLILGGYSNSINGNTKSGKLLGGTDFWLLKLKKNGTKQWDKTIGGSAGDGFGEDYLVSVQQTKDKGYILGGYSNSNIGNSKTQNSKGGYDYWIVKVDSLGKVKWDKTIGGSADDILTGVYELDSARYIVAGTSRSPISGDKTSDVVGGNGTSDYWIVMLGNAIPSHKIVAPVQKAAPIAANNKYSLDVLPNPVKDVLTIKYNALINSKADFIIYSVSGSAVLQSTLTASAGTSTQSFNVAHLAAGSYFAVMYFGNTKITKAFTKE